MIMCCVWCNKEMGKRLNWKRLLLLSESKSLCSICEDKLDIIQGKRCQMCSRQSDEHVCSDCIYWQRRDPSLSFNHSVFRYNERMQKMIARWKYRGDYVLGDAFKEAFQKEFKRIFAKFDRDTILVPIPLSEERLFERGFNQAQILADFLPMPIYPVLKRVHSEKQSKKTRYERLASKNPFKLDQSMNTKVILIDDIYTTGTTLRHAALCLKARGASEVYAYTLIRG